MLEDDMKKFANEILRFQREHGISDRDFSGMLCGAAASVTARAGIDRQRGINVFSKSYDHFLGISHANDA